MGFDPPYVSAQVTKETQHGVAELEGDSGIAELEGDHVPPPPAAAAVVKGVRFKPQTGQKKREVRILSLG
jgi:hypothetical protein